MNNIDFGIDLGTTNSGIGKFQNGKVQVFKNPVGFKETLPSVVAYRNDRILIGDKAREFIKTQPNHVFSSFKRKMGSDFVYQLPHMDEQKTPIDFSTLILKELMNFTADERPKAAVITIPASFDTIQSNATKTAGYNAGLKEVVLLQEPIAACLAYANTQNLDINEQKKWLVYDFGGGTFDVALVKINDRELKIIDHEGNNFLGGVDIDQLMVEQLFCPQLEKILGEDGLWKRMVGSEDLAYQKMFMELAYKAEEAKKELSINEESFVEMEISGDFIEMKVTRQQFNDLIKPKVDETIKLTQSLLEKNQIGNQEIDRIILVGGTTYIPYIKKSLADTFHCYVDNTIDPTTAIIVGAAYFAGTKAVEEKAQNEEVSVPEITQLKEVKLVYEINSQDNEELLTGLVAGEFSGYYRITRLDGGFDTGMMPFHTRFNEFLKLLPKSINYFNVKIFDKLQHLVFEKGQVAINHGVYNISGQPLPNDICIEVDDTVGSTFLEKIFKKNEILPLSKTVYKTISKTILKGTDDQLIINVVEGNAATSPASNLCIGYLEIAASKLSANLLKGTDIELKFEISESRDLTISLFIDAIGLELEEVFNASARNVSLEKIKTELNNALNQIDWEIEDFSYKGLDDVMEQLNVIRMEIIELMRELIEAEDDLVTDKIFNIDERKRKVFQAFDQQVRGKNLLEEIEEYQLYKQQIKEELLLHPNPKIDRMFQIIIKNEQVFLNSDQISVVRSKIKELKRLARELYYQHDEAYIDLFYDYAHLSVTDYENETQAKKLISKGEDALERRNFQELKSIISSLYNLLKVKPKDYLEDQNGTLGLR